MQSDNLVEQRLSDVQILNSLLCLFHTTDAHFEVIDLDSSIIETKSEIELEAELIRIANQKSSGHFFTFCIVFPFEVCFCEVQRDLQVVREFLVGSLVQIEGVIIIFFVHKKVSMVK